MSSLEIFLIAAIASQNIGLLIVHALDRQVRRDVAQVRGSAA